MRLNFLTRVLPVAGLAAATLVAGCTDPLQVDNKNNPDVSRAYASLLGVETVVSKLVQQIHQGLYGTTTNLLPGAMTMSFESASQLGNFCMGTRSAIPRSAIDNGRGNTCEGENFRTYDVSTRNGRSAVNALNALLDAKKAGKSIGTAARDTKARSVAYFSLALALGETSLFYDSAAVMLPGLQAGEVPPLASYKDVNKAAIQMLDSALAEANSAGATNGTDGWPIPEAWIPTPGGAGTSLATWKQLIRSFRARFRAEVARTPADRAAADWDAIIADATNGLTADYNVQMTASNGWSNSWYSQAAVSAGWHEMPLMIIGMADTTRAYDAWLATQVSQRDVFLIRTPDKRFPSGDTRAAQQAVTGSSRVPPANSKLYIRNRPTGEDTPGYPWGTSYYDFFRYWGYRANGSNGPNNIFSVAETDMLAAEGYLRKNNFAAATALIDKYRTAAGLPATAGITSLTQPVPGGNACVPRVPTSAGNATQCGNVFEAMKWEKRMETAWNGYAQWYLDSRGWGDLWSGTPLDWPVPYQEMDARAKPFYNSTTAAAKGTYGW